MTDFSKLVSVCLCISNHRIIYTLPRAKVDISFIIKARDVMVRAKVW